MLRQFWNISLEQQMKSLHISPVICQENSLKLGQLMVKVHFFDSYKDRISLKGKEFA